MKKIAIAIVVALVLLPIVPRLLPKALTMERIQEGFEKSPNLTVERVDVVPTPQLEAIEQLSMTISGSDVQVYHFDDVGKVAVQEQYQLPGPGTVETTALGLSDLAASLGAAKPKNKPTEVARRGMFLIVIIGDDRATNTRIKTVFEML
jgi:hypothetical protein